MRTRTAALLLLAIACQSERDVSWDEIAGKPSSFPSDWSAVANRPASFPTEWSVVAGKPAAFPTDPALVQARIAGACADGTAISAVNQDGSVACAAAGAGRPITVQLPAPTWAVVQCASVPTSIGLGGVIVPAVRFDATGACGTVRLAGTGIAIPAELPAGPRPFRVRAVVSTLDAPAPVELSLEWRVATAGAGAGASACSGSRTVVVPQLLNVQAITTVEFDFRGDTALCGAPGDPLVLMLQRTDAAASAVAVRAIHAVFE
jgi:hypothetical protein